MALILAWVLPLEPTYEGRRLSAWIRGGVTDEGRVAVKSMGSNAVPFLLAKLQREDPLPEKWVAEFFSYRGWGRLPTRLAWSDWHDAAAGFDALGEMAAGALPELEQSLDDGERVFAVARALCAIGSKAIPALTNGLASTNPIVRSTIAAMLFRLGTNGAPAIPALLGLLGDPDGRVVNAAISTLGSAAYLRLAPERVVPGLAGCLDNSNHRVRVQALEVLARFECAARGALPEVVESLNDPVEKVRQAAVHAAFRIHPAPVTMMAARLRHPEARVRKTAVTGLTSHCFRDCSQDTNVFCTMTNLLTDPDPSVRKEVVRALHRLNRRMATRMKVGFADE